MLEKGNKGGEIGRNAKLEAEKKKEKKKKKKRTSYSKKKIGDGELASPACVLKTVFKSRA